LVALSTQNVEIYRIRVLPTERTFLYHFTLVTLLWVACFIRFNAIQLEEILTLTLQVTFVLNWAIRWC